MTLKFLLQATGDVSNSDIDLAVATEAIILGFNVKAPGSVKSYAEKKGVEIRLYRVIYELIDDVRNAMEGLLETVEVNSNATLCFCFYIYNWRGLKISFRLDPVYNLLYYIFHDW